MAVVRVAVKGVVKVEGTGERVREAERVEKETGAGKENRGDEEAVEAVMGEAAARETEEGTGAEKVGEVMAGTETEGTRARMGTGARVKARAGPETEAGAAKVEMGLAPRARALQSVRRRAPRSGGSLLTSLQPSTCSRTCSRGEKGVVLSKPLLDLVRKINILILSDRQSCLRCLPCCPSPAPTHHALVVRKEMGRQT